MPTSMRVERNIKSTRNERVTTANIEDITYVERQSFLRGESSHHARTAPRQFSTGRSVYWQTYEQDHMERHLSPHSPGGDLADRHAYSPCSKLASEKRLKGMIAYLKKEGKITLMLQCHTTEPS